MAVDWLKIKNDYINGSESYLALAEKYGVSHSSIRKRAAAEKWTELREKQRNKIGTKVEQKIADIVVDTEVKRMTRILTLSDKLSDQLERAIDELDRQMVKYKTKQRVLEYKDSGTPGKPTKETINETETVEVVAGAIDRLGLQQLSAALKNIKDTVAAAEQITPPGDSAPEDDLSRSLRELGEDLQSDD